MELLFDLLIAVIIIFLLFLTLISIVIIITTGFRRSVDYAFNKILYNDKGRK